ncbi:MAG: rhodanese-like domain-containing protein [Sciscionella sp.]
MTPRQPGGRSIAETLEAARARLRRLAPAQSAEALARGAFLVDIRPVAQRRKQGEVPGALIIERNVLEWRFDPACEARLPQVTGYDHEVVIMCVEGYTSSLAAASLLDLGLTRVTDMDGGFMAWAAAGLPTVSTAER